MQTNILWTGREYGSLENCLIIPGETIEINSVIIGNYEKKVYRAEYFIAVNNAWETQYCKIKAHFDGKTVSYDLFSIEKGKWTLNGTYSPGFDECTDVDILLTPFTNTLPVNRLKLLPGEQYEIRVLYIDILQEELKAVRQKYTRLTEYKYKFENVPNDFETVITVDQSGFVTDYPGLFTRSAITNYPA